MMILLKKKIEKDNKTARGHLLNHMSNHLFDLFVTYKSVKEIRHSLKRNMVLMMQEIKNMLSDNGLNFK